MGRTTFLKFCACSISVLLATTSHAAVWTLAGDFSTAANPNGAWQYGSEPSTSGPLTPYNTTAAVPLRYNTTQLAGWSDTAVGNLPFIAKNTSATNWNYDGTSVGGAIGVITPGQVFLHPYATIPRISVARWTAPSTGLYSINAGFQRFEQKEGDNTGWGVVRNGTFLTGGSGTLFGFTDPRSSAAYTNASIALNAGDTIDFDVGLGPDGSSDTDGTILQATIQTVPEPAAPAVVAIAATALLKARRRRKV